MSKLIKDVLYLIFKELWDGRTSLYSCLLVNKAWCKIIIPILWKDPWKYLRIGKEKSLLNVIISHFSDKSKDNINQSIDFLTNSYQKPLFDYISFCKHLNLNEIKRIIDIIHIYRKKSTIPIITNEILNLFINENTKFTHLYLPHQFDYQINLIPGVENCLSELEYLYCSIDTNDSALAGLAGICKSIKELEVSVIKTSDNYGVVRLIEAQKRLNKINFQFNSSNESFCKILENSLIKHANTIQYFKINKKPVTKILSSFNNLKILEMGETFHATTWDHVENSSLPFLQILRVRNIPVKSVTRLIGKTKGHLTEIKVDHSTYNEFNEFDHRFIRSLFHATDNRKLIKAIYQNCSNLKYLKINFKNVDTLELEQLLTKCQCLDGLYIYFNYFDYERETFREVDCDKLFSILTNSSPANLFKFKFQSSWKIKLTSFKLFFNSWRGRRPMLLQTVKTHLTNDYFGLIDNYEFLGVIKNYYNDVKGNSFEDFEWINPNF